MIIYNELDGLIAEAMKAKDEARLSTYRMIKTKFMEYRTSKGAKEIDESVEIQILRKMVNERKDAMKMYSEAGRKDLAEKEHIEMHIIESFLPEEVSEDQVAHAFVDVCTTGLEPIKRNMGMFIKKIKEVLPTADGKLVSTYVLSKLS